MNLFTHFTFLQCQNHQFEELLLFFLLACLSANVPVHAQERLTDQVVVDNEEKFLNAQREQLSGRTDKAITIL